MATTAFTFGGTALSSVGKVTLINDYLDTAARRGENQVIPYRNGAIHVPKFYESRSFLFGIAITASTAQALEAAFDTLRSLLSSRDEQTLSMTMENGDVRTIQASANSPLEVERITGKFARVTLELIAAKPYWRLSTNIADNTTTINASPKAMTVTNPGTVEERDPVIVLTGPLQNTVITNSTLGISLTYTGTIASPRVVTIKTNTYNEYVATDDLNANVIGNVTHSGSSALMAFQPGDNTMSITDATATTGTVKRNGIA